MAKKKTKPVEQQVEIETPITEVETVVENPVQEEAKTGVVYDCGVLNVRIEPKVGAKVISIISRGTVVKIDEEKSDRDFYKIETADGISGFCMKKFIKTS